MSDELTQYKWTLLAIAVLYLGTLTAGYFGANVDGGLQIVLGGLIGALTAPRKA
jgi:hypothetical protein